MLSSKQTRRAQTVLMIGAVLFALYYVFVFRPLAQRSIALDQPLGDAWKKLAVARVSSNEDQELNLDEIDAKLREVKAALANVKNAEDAIRTAVALDPAIRDKMREPFQLVDFQIEELLRIEELGRSAQQNGVTIAPAVFSNFPEYRADRGEPELLWGQLGFLHQVLAAAVQAKVTNIQNIQLPPYTLHSHDTNSPAFLYEVPIQVDLVGSMESVSKFLAVLPQRGSGEKAVSDPAVNPSKPSLFIDRILVRKNSPERPDEAHLVLRVSGFIYKN